MFETAVTDGVLRARRPGTRWLSTGWDGGFTRADAAYNLTVPEGFERTDVTVYVKERLARAGFDEPGAALLTGVGLEHARGARAGPVEVLATAGLSNPAALPMSPEDPASLAEPLDRVGEDEPGTVNLIVGTDRALNEGALASLLGVVAEAKAATLLAETGFPGTTTDAVVVGADPNGEPSEFAGSATAVGGAARACVREAVRSSLRSRYSDEPMPTAVDEASYGLRTDVRAEVFTP